MSHIVFALDTPVNRRCTQPQKAALNLIAFKISTLSTVLR